SVSGAAPAYRFYPLSLHDALPICFAVVVAPTITSFTPSSGRVGASVTISGANFMGATAVTFNGSAASFTVTSDTAIQTTVPAGADRQSTRLNSSHDQISYAVFCLT